MLDIKLIRETPDIFRKDLKKRGDSEKQKLLEELIDKDIQWRKLNIEIDKLKNLRNVISKEIGELKQQGKDAVSKLKEAETIPKQIEEREEEMDKLKERCIWVLMRLPNILHESVPIGKNETENQEIKKWGEIPKIDFELLPHGELMEKLDIGDFERAAKVSGRGFYYLKGDLALLSQALTRFTIDFLMKKGYMLIETPLMLRRKPYEGVTDLDDFKTMMYKIDDEDLYMIATAEHPIAAMHMSEIIDDKELPLRYIGTGPCFRKEIGSHGVDEKGLFRVHQFNKVEQFIFCKPEDSWKLHEELIANSEELYQKLKLPYRIVNVCTGDIGIVAAKKYDLEAWSPRQNKYIEVSSCSNCTDYQARRLGIRAGKVGSDKKILHTLNSTALALSRTLVAILENYQQKDGSVKIPEVLVPYMNGIKEITNK